MATVSPPGEGAMSESHGLPRLTGAPDGWMPATEFCPVAIGTRLIADRWTMLIVRELLIGASGFNAIHRGLPALSRTLLSSRLRYLQRIGVVEPQGPAAVGTRREYRLTNAGLALRPVLEALAVWARDWQLPPSAYGEVNVATLMWQMNEGLTRDQVPVRELTLAFRFPESQPRSAWIHVAPEGSRACIGVPDSQPDLTVIVDAVVLNELWWDKRSCDEAIRRGDVGFEGGRVARDDVTRRASRLPRRGRPRAPCAHSPRLRDFDVSIVARAVAFH